MILLRGRVLPIGGLKEKVLAAHRGGIKIVICPGENEKDLKDIPDKVKNDLEFIFVENMDEVLKIALMHPLPGHAELDAIVGDKDFSSVYDEKAPTSEPVKH